MDPEFDNLKQAPTFVEQANTSVNETDDCNPGIKVIGVGGGGSNAVANMYKKGIKGVDFYICNTDMQALRNSAVPGKIAIGEYGAGGNPEIAAELARENAESIIKCCEKDTRMVFLAACMGGGTGTGATPVIAETIKQIKLDDRWIKDILIVAVVTTPFRFEGRKKLNYAKSYIHELRKYADSVIVINNDKLRTFGNMELLKAFELADETIYTATKSIAQIITEHNYINTDFHDVYNIMSGSKTALMGCGYGSGENRIKDAIEAASSSVLLDDQDIRNAKGCLLSITYSSEHAITIDEFDYIQDYVLEDLIDSNDPDSDVIWGTGIDESLGDKVQVTLVATGFDMPTEEAEPIRIIKEGKSEPKDQTNEVTEMTREGQIIETPTTESKTEKPVTDEEITVYTKAEETPAAQTTSNTEKKAEEKIVVDIDGNTIEVAPSATTTQQPAATAAETTDKPSANERSIYTISDDGVDITLNTQLPEPVKAATAPVAEPTVEPAFDAKGWSPKVDPDKGGFTDKDCRRRMEALRELMQKHGPDVAARMTIPNVSHIDSFSEMEESAAATIGADGVVNYGPSLYSNAD